MGATDTTAVRLQVSVEEIDRSSIHLFEAELAEAVRHHRGDASLVVDLGAVRFLDSSGIRALIDAERAVAQTGGRLNVVGATGIVRRVLEVAGVWEHFAAVSTAA